MTEPAIEQDVATKRWDVVILNVAATTALFLALQAWLSYYTNWPTIANFVGTVTWVLGYVKLLLPNSEKNFLLRRPRAWLFFEPLSVLILGVLALLCVTGSFFGSLLIKPIAGLQQVYVADDLASLDSVPPYSVLQDGDQKYPRAVATWPLSEPLFAKADGFPKRMFFLEPGRRRQIDSEFFWHERVLFLLPTKRLTAFIPKENNDTLLVIRFFEASSGKKLGEDIEIDDYDGKPLVMGPVATRIAIPPALLAEWKPLESFVESWQEPAIRPEFQDFLDPETDFEVELRYKTSSTPITSKVIGQSQHDKRAAKRDAPNWRWKVIDYVPPKSQ